MQLEKALVQYPNNYILLAELIEIRVQRFKMDCDKESWLEDISQKANMVLDNCTDDGIRYKVKTSLVFAYSFCGKRKEAEQICDTFPENAYSKIEMYSMISPPKERVNYKWGCIGRYLESSFVDMLAIAIHHYSFAKAEDALAYPCSGENNNDRVAEIIKQNTGVKYSRTIVSTGNFDIQNNIYCFNSSIYHLEFDKLMKMGKDF